MKITGCKESGASTDDCMALREKIKAVELEAEHLEQNALERLTPAPATEALQPQVQINSTATNIRRYLDYNDVQLDSASLLHLARIVTAAVEGADNDEVTSTLDTVFRAR